MKTLKLFFVVVALTVLGFIFSSPLLLLGILASNGMKYMVEQQGGLLFGIVIIGTIVTVVMAACRTPQK
jgi:hypothetical protein